MHMQLVRAGAWAVFTKPRESHDAPSLRIRSDRVILSGLPPEKVAALRSSSGVAAGSSATWATRGSGRAAASSKRPALYSATEGGTRSSALICAAPLLLVLA